MRALARRAAELAGEAPVDLFSSDEKVPAIKPG
jgi:hypothetical protein